MKEKEVKGFVKKRYSKIAASGASCCSSTESLTKQAELVGYSEEEIKSVPEESNMGLGCGNPVTLAGLNQGETVLDLGSGGGVDVFLASKKVGPKGKVIGVDMTRRMIARARQIAEKYGYDNVEFRLGEIEKLPVEDCSIDVIISNCVINLSPDKKMVFKEAYRVLKPTGRMLISDMVTEGRLPSSVRKNLNFWASCIAGAMDKEEYLKTIEEAGFKKVKIVSESNHEFDVSEKLKGRIASVRVEARKGLIE
jgi:arsenite methyltransferase